MLAFFIHLALGIANYCVSTGGLFSKGSLISPACRETQIAAAFAGYVFPAQLLQQ